MKGITTILFLNFYFDRVVFYRWINPANEGNYDLACSSLLLCLFPVELIPLMKGITTAEQALMEALEEAGVELIPLMKGITTFPCSLL